MSTATLQSDHNTIHRTVRRFGRFRKRWLTITDFSWFVIIGPGIMLLWLLVDWECSAAGLSLPSWPLVIGFGVGVALTLWAVVWHVVRPQFRRIKTEHEALLIESLHGELDNRLIGCLQLGRQTIEAERHRGRSLQPFSH